MNIWRINLKTIGNNVRQFCLDKGIVGVGWPIPQKIESNDIDSYYKHGLELYHNLRNDKGWKAAISAVGWRLKINDLIWTRDKHGNYYIGRVSSSYQYCDKDEHLEQDLVNFRHCDWVSVGTVESVPGKVVRSFIPSRTIQRVNSDIARIYSMYLYNLKYAEHYKLPLDQETEIYDCLSADECEDLVAFYLQIKLDYLIIPSSSKNYTLHYEFVLKNRKDGSNAVVQVKNGNIDLMASDYSSLECTVYLFTSYGEIIGKNENVIGITKNELNLFISENFELLPSRIKNWINIIEELKKK